MQFAPVTMNINNNLNSSVLKPILFNCWKHHKLFIQNEINKFITINSPSAIELLKKQLLIIGESQTDLYTGHLSPSQIITSITDQLKTLDVFEIDKYKNWIFEDGTDYKTLTLEDNSCWTLRPGERDDQYIHIHPCRNTLYSIRVRASNLKTAIAVIVWSGIYNNSHYDIAVVNKIRKEILSECPVKSLEISTALNKIIHILLT